MCTFMWGTDQWSWLLVCDLSLHSLVCFSEYVWNSLLLFMLSLWPFLWTSEYPKQKSSIKLSAVSLRASSALLLVIGSCMGDTFCIPLIVGPLRYQIPACPLPFPAEHSTPRYGEHEPVHRGGWRGDQDWAEECSVHRHSWPGVLHPWGKQRHHTWVRRPWTTSSWWPILNPNP